MIIVGYLHKRQQWFAYLDYENLETAHEVTLNGLKEATQLLNIEVNGGEIALINNITTQGADFNIETSKTTKDHWVVRAADQLKGITVVTKPYSKISDAIIAACMRWRIDALVKARKSTSN